MAHSVLGPPECLVPVASEEGDLGDHCRGVEVEAERPGHLHVAPGARLTHIEVGVAHELINPETDGVRHVECVGVAEARCQRCHLFTHLGGQLHPAELDRGDFHHDEDRAQLPQVAPCPQQA